MTERDAAPGWGTWTVNGRLRADTSTLTLGPPARPWYRTKQATMVLIAAAAGVVTVPVAMLVLRDSSWTGPERATSVAPQASTSPAPAPSSAELSPTSAPPPPPPLAPTEDPGSAVDQPDPWTGRAPTTRKPEARVTPTPVTRLPMSVAPIPRQPPENNSATPGNGHKPWSPF